MKILICGLPRAGKTTLANALYKHLDSCEWFNADEVRKQSDDWDFTSQGRLRQAERMRKLCDDSGAAFCICDFVAPTKATREAFGADFVVWMDTISESRYKDTNAIYEQPERVNIRVTTKDADYWAEIIYERLFN